jgi:hypothetical protein
MNQSINIGKSPNRMVWARKDDFESSSSIFCLGLDGCR